MNRETDPQDHGFYLGLKGLCFFVLGLFAVLLLFLFKTSYPTLRGLGFHFFTSTQWAPGREQFGALPFIYGTLLTSLIALLIAVPISVATALFLTELSPKWLRMPLGFLVEMLAAVPSVVYGLWGIFVLAPWMRTELQPALQYIFGSHLLLDGPPLGVGLFTGGVILSIMIIPTITSITREVFRSVPDILREGALALGATKIEMIHEAVVKTGLSGILGAVILGLGRAIGETMAVTMVIGNRPDITLSIFKPAATMASVIANEYAEADTLGLHLSSLSAIGLSLFVVALLVNLLARVIILNLKRTQKGLA